MSSSLPPLSHYNFQHSQQTYWAIPPTISTKAMDRQYEEEYCYYAPHHTLTTTASKISPPPLKLCPKVLSDETPKQPKQQLHLIHTHTASYTTATHPHNPSTHILHTNNTTPSLTLFFALTSAPCSISSPANSVWPFKAAQWRGVSLFCINNRERERERGECRSERGMSGWEQQLMGDDCTVFTCVHTPSTSSSGVWGVKILSWKWKETKKHHFNILTIIFNIHNKHFGPFPPPFQLK